MMGGMSMGSATSFSNGGSGGPGGGGGDMGGALSGLSGQFSVFGFKGTQKGVSGLIGYFYDIKQTNKRTPTPNFSHELYQSTMKEFTEKWDIRLLDKFYRSETALTTPYVYVPVGPSGAAAKAFGEEKFCQGSHWIVHYRGQAIAPKTGTFRFIGVGDNTLVVGLNDKIVLDGGNPHIVDPKMNTERNVGVAGPNWPMAAGAWFQVSSGDLMKVDILIGDTGGAFCGYVLIEEKGVKYAPRKELSDGGKFLSYPLFQVIPAPPPKEAGKGTDPDVDTKTGLIFKGTNGDKVMSSLKRDK